MITAPADTYGDLVPNQPKTPSRSLRVEDADWQEMAKMAADLGTDRNKLLVQLIRWYLGRPEVEMPRRPDAASNPTEQ